MVFLSILISNGIRVSPALDGLPLWFWSFLLWRLFNNDVHLLLDLSEQESLVRILVKLLVDLDHFFVFILGIFNLGDALLEQQVAEEVA